MAPVAATPTSSRAPTARFQSSSSTRRASDLIGALVGVMRRLELEEGRFGVRAAEVPAHAAVRLDDTVAGHDNRQRVRGACGTDGADRLGTTRKLGDGRIAGGVAVPDVREVLQHGCAEAGRQSPVEGQAECSSASGEVLVELAGGGVETGWMTQDARADPIGQRLQDAIVILGGVGNSHQSGVGGGEQQTADRTVDRAVGDIEETFGVGCCRESAVEAVEVIGVHDERPLECFGEIRFGVHRVLLSVV